MQGDRSKIFGALTLQQTLFVHEYTHDWDRRKAAVRAGVPYARAVEFAVRVLCIPGVVALIDDIVAQRVERIQVDTDWVLQEAVKLYSMSLSEVVRVDTRGQPYFDFRNVSTEFLSALQSIKIKQGKYGVEVQLQLPDKRQILKMIGEHVQVDAWGEKGDSAAVINLNFDAQDKSAL